MCVAGNFRFRCLSPGRLYHSGGWCQCHGATDLLQEIQRAVNGAFTERALVASYLDVFSGIVALKTSQADVRTLLTLSWSPWTKTKAAEDCRSPKTWRTSRRTL